MPYAVHATSAPTATAFAKSFHPDPAPNIIVAEPKWAYSAPEQPVSDSEPQRDETETGLTSAAFLDQLSASIAEINQPISAVVMNAEAALRRRPANRYRSSPAVARLYRQGRNAERGHRQPHPCADQESATEATVT
jgi:hypothetical protein